MSEIRLSKQFAGVIRGASSRAILLVLAALFLVAYLPLTLLTVAGYHSRALDDAAALGITLAAAIFTAWVACSRLDRSPPPDRELRREKWGWRTFAFAASLIFTGRAIYSVAVLQLNMDDSIPVADALMGVGFLLLPAGIVLFPWTSGKETIHSALLNAGIVLVVAGTILWPVLIGPLLGGEFGPARIKETVIFHIIGIFAMTFGLLWMMMRGVRDELRPVAWLLIAGVGTLVLIEILYLTLFVARRVDQLPLVAVNAMGALAFVFVIAAAALRLKIASQTQVEQDADLVVDEAPVRRREILLPYPMIVALLALRLSIELFGWRSEYDQPMIFGAMLFVALLMTRQVQLLRRSDRLYQRVAEIAIRDGLTRLYNHRAMHEILTKQIAQADHSGQSLAVLFFDVDEFKEFNDTYGHRKGDWLLREIANVLVERSRDSDYVGRYGGEEFMIIASDITAVDACELANRLRESVEAWTDRPGVELTGVTVSVGVAMFPEDGRSPGEVISRADEAMYRAKGSGRNTCKLYNPRLAA